MNTNIHDNCGGTILSATLASVGDYNYCDTCDAFAYNRLDDCDPPTGDFPSGIDRDTNKAAWDAGDDSSPARST